MKSMKRKPYEAALEHLQVELVAMARWIRHSGARVVVVMEGRDTAGKGGAIDAIQHAISPSICRVVALKKPTERESSQWYFQRYVSHLPAAGEMCVFDRSWYNRAGVEAVMGFTPKASVTSFLAQVPTFEKLLVDDGILLIKYWLTCDQAQQEERISERVHDPLKRWKLSDVDLKGRTKYDAYTEARDTMLRATHTAHAPWTLVDFNEQRVGRLTLVRDLLDRMPDTFVAPAKVAFTKLRTKPSVDDYQVLGPIAPFKP